MVNVEMEYCYWLVSGKKSGEQTVKLVSFPSISDVMWCGEKRAQQFGLDTVLLILTKCAASHRVHYEKNTND